MNSYADDVKNEIARVIPKKLCCKSAELMSLLRMSANNFISEDSFTFSTSNAAIARKILLLVSLIEPSVNTRVEMKKATKLRKNNRYIIHATNAGKLFKELGYLDEEKIFDVKKIRRDCCKKSFLRGAFLGSGSVNKPESDYHLEITSHNFTIATFVLDLLNRLQFNAHLSERGKKFIVYFKESESILDFLSMIHAPNAVEKFESARNLKEIRGQVNMIVNLETANLQKSAEVSARQLEDIELLEKSDQLKNLSTKLLQAVEIRKKYPESTLSELANILQIKPSTLNYRFKKIHNIVRKN